MTIRPYLKRRAEDARVIASNYRAEAARLLKLSQDLIEQADLEERLATWLAGQAAGLREQMQGCAQSQVIPTIPLKPP